MPTNYYKKYKKYKKKYLGGTIIKKENIHPLGCFGEYGNERFCFLIDVPGYTAYNGKIKNKLPFYISTGTSKNNPSMRIVPFNGEVTFPRAQDIKNYNLRQDHDLYATLEELNNGLRHMHNQMKLSEVGKSILFNTSDLKDELKKLLLSESIMDDFMNPDTNDYRMIVFHIWAVKIEDCLKSGNSDILRHYYPKEEQIHKLNLNVTEKHQLLRNISTLKDNFNNLNKYYNDKLQPFVTDLNNKLKIIDINRDRNRNINTIKFQYKNGEPFEKIVPCSTNYSIRDINSHIGTNNIFGINLSSLNRIVPLTQYKKILYKLTYNNPEKLNELGTEDMTFRDLLSEGKHPTFTDILYNLLICLLDDNRQHWCEY